jgi:pimeloyl-ACP methyl ester carboxylesterase
MELSDLESVLDFVRGGMLTDSEQLIVMGHSRGGGIASLAASRTDVDGLVLLASVSDFESRFPSGEALNKWRSSDRLEVLNGRTMQVLSHSFTFYEDFIANSASLNIESAIRRLSCPLLVIHGDADDAVDLSEGQALAEWANNGNLVVIPEAAHTFGASHPWKSADLPPHTIDVVHAVKQFLANL